MLVDLEVTPTKKVDKLDENLLEFNIDDETLQQQRIIEEKLKQEKLDQELARKLQKESCQSSVNDQNSHPLAPPTQPKDKYPKSPQIQSNKRKINAEESPITGAVKKKGRQMSMLECTPYLLSGGKEGHAASPCPNSLNDQNSGQSQSASLLNTEKARGSESLDDH